MKEGLTLSKREARRARVLTHVLQGKLAVLEAAELPGMSERHARRLLSGFREQGAASLAHGNRGRASARRLEKHVHARVVQLAKMPYGGAQTTRPL